VTSKRCLSMSVNSTHSCWSSSCRCSASVTAAAGLFLGGPHGTTASVLCRWFGIQDGVLITLAARFRLGAQLSSHIYGPLASNAGEAWHLLGFGLPTRSRSSWTVGVASGLAMYGLVGDPVGRTQAVAAAAVAMVIPYRTDIYVRAACRVGRL
jgi:hypothetical protein